MCAFSCEWAIFQVRHLDTFCIVWQQIKLNSVLRKLHTSVLWYSIKISLFSNTMFEKSIISNVLWIVKDMCWNLKLLLKKKVCKKRVIIQRTLKICIHGCLRSAMLFVMMVLCKVQQSAVKFIKMWKNTYVSIRPIIFAWTIALPYTSCKIDRICKKWF